MKLRADRSVYSTVSRFVEDEHLRQAFSFHSLLVGGNPFDTSSIYTLIHYLERNWGVFFPRGGTGALVRAWVRLFQELGHQAVLIPGDPEHEAEKIRSKYGIPVIESVVNDLKEISAMTKVEFQMGDKTR